MRCCQPGANVMPRDRADLAGDADAELVERAVADAVLGGHHPVGQDERPPQLPTSAYHGTAAGSCSVPPTTAPAGAARSRNVRRARIPVRKVPSAAEGGERSGVSSRCGPRSASADRVVAQPAAPCPGRAASRARPAAVRAAGRADAGRARSVPQRDVDEHAARAAAGAVALAPLHQRVHGGPQLDAGLGEHSSSRPGAYGRRSTRPRSTSEREARAEHGARDVEVALQVGEAPDAEEQVAHDQQRPALAHHLERARERAGLALVVACAAASPRSRTTSRFNE